MAENIKIKAGERQSVAAAHSRPTEDTLPGREDLLIIMAHSFPGTMNGPGNLFLDLEFLLRDKGYHTLRFDYRGCGQSDGRPEEFTLAAANEDFQSVLHWARTKGYRRFITLGEGLGAAICLMNIEDSTLASVLFWPYLDLPRIARITYRPEQIEEQWIKAGYLLIDGQRIGVPFIKELQKQNISYTLKGLKIPLLVMHGAQDTVSPIDQLEIIRMNVGSRRVEITSFHDGVHGLPDLNHRKAMYYHIKQFAEKYS